MLTVGILKKGFWKSGIPKTLPVSEIGNSNDSKHLK